MKNKHKNIKKYIIYGIFVLICSILYFLNLKNKIVDVQNINENKYYLLYFALSMLTLIIIILLIFKINKNEKINYTKFFIICSIMLGGLYLVCSPLFTGSDEQSHYYRIYEITDGNIKTPINNNVIGGSLPSSLKDMYILCNSQINYNYNQYIKYDDVLKMIKIPLNQEKKEVYSNSSAKDYVGASLYSPLQYTPHIIGFLIGKMLLLPPYFIGLLGRLFNLIFYIFICSFGLKKLPKAKLFAVAILLSPSLLVGATTLSCDGFTCAIIFLFIAYLISIYTNKNKLNFIDKLILLILSIFIAVCKIVYLPIIFLLLAIPKVCFKSLKEKSIYISLVFIISILCSAIWLNTTNEYFQIYYPNSELQKAYVFNNVFEYLFIVIRTYCEKFTTLVSNLFVGNELYHSQLPIYSIISIAYLIIVFLSMFNDNNKSYVNNKYIIFVSTIILIIGGLIASALYIQCTAQFIQLANPTVGGLQGRYFIPLLFLLMIIVSFKKEILNEKLICEFLLLIQYPVLLTIYVQFMI